MFATIRRANLCIYKNVWNILDHRLSETGSVNLLYRVRSDQLFAQVPSMTKAIPFQHLPLALLKPFSTCSSLTSSTGSASGASMTETEIFDEMEKVAYKLFYLELDQDDMSKLSALWMQAMEGPCQQAQPTDGSVDLAYWENWKSLGEMTKEIAAQEYLKIARKYVKAK